MTRVVPSSNYNFRKKFKPGVTLNITHNRVKKWIRNSLNLNTGGQGMLKWFKSI